MNFIAANFLLHYSERNSFILFCYLLNERNFRILFEPKSSALVDYIKVFEKRLKVNYKRVYNHFKELNFISYCYTIEWFTTCFLVSCPGELSSCVMDMLMIDVHDTLIRVGLSIIANLEPRLLELDLEKLQISFKNLVAQLPPADVISVAFSIQSKGDADVLKKLSAQRQQAELENTSPWSRSHMEVRQPVGLIASTAYI